MNILILTGRFGMGHVSASNAIKQEICESFPNTNINIVDFVDYVLPSIKEAIYKSFNFVVSKWPKLFNFLFIIFDKYDVTPFKGFSNKKISTLLASYPADLII